MYEEIKGLLKKNFKARERKNKNRFIAWFLWQKWHMDTRTLDYQFLAKLFVEFASYDRAWRQVLEKNPHLRGSDYSDKSVLEEDKQLELGYNI